MTDTTAPIRHLPRDVRIGLVIAVGGAVGALARWSIGESWPTDPGAFPAATFAINVVGCAAIGVLMVVVEQALRGRVYVRPLIGVGFLGGFTTFSTFAVETRALLDEHPLLAVLYYLGTPICAVVAVAVGASLTTDALAVAARRTSRRQS